VLIQMAFTVLFVLPRFFMKGAPDKDGKPTKAIELGEWIDFLWFAPAPCFLFAGMLLTSMYAYSYNTVATIVVFRNLSPLFAMAAELLQAKPIDVNTAMVFALCMAVVGCVVFGHGNIQLSVMGFVTVMLNLFIATTERVVVRWIMKKEVVGADGNKRQLKINDSGMMFYYNALGMVPAALLILAFGEYKEYATVWSALTPTGGLYVALSCIVGVAISYTGFRLQRRVSATTFLVTTNTNKMAVIGFGAFVLKDKYTVFQVIGCGLAMSSALVYAKANMSISAKKKTEADAQKAVEEAEKDAIGGSGKIPALANSTEKTPLMAAQSMPASIKT